MRLVPGFINSIYCASIAQLWWRRMDPLLPLQLPYIGSSCKVLRCSHRLHPRGASQRQGTTPVSLPPYIVPSVSAGKSLSLRVPHRTTLPPFAALLVAVSENQLASLLRACAAKVISVRVRWTSTVLTTGGEERSKIPCARESLPRPPRCSRITPLHYTPIRRGQWGGPDLQHVVYGPDWSRAAAIPCVV
jgi:hypothetical protein